MQKLLWLVLQFLFGLEHTQGDVLVLSHLVLLNNFLLDFEWVSFLVHFLTSIADLSIVLIVRFRSLVLFIWNLIIFICVDTQLFERILEALINFSISLFSSYFFGTLYGLVGCFWSGDFSHPFIFRIFNFFNRRLNGLLSHFLQLHELVLLRAYFLALGLGSRKNIGFINHLLWFLNTLWRLFSCNCLIIELARLSNLFFFWFLFDMINSLSTEWFALLAILWLLRDNLLLFCHFAFRVMLSSYSHFGLRLLWRSLFLNSNSFLRLVRFRTLGLWFGRSCSRLQLLSRLLAWLNHELWSFLIAYLIGQALSMFINFGQFPVKVVLDFVFE